MRKIATFFQPKFRDCRPWGGKPASSSALSALPWGAEACANSTHCLAELRAGGEEMHQAIKNLKFYFLLRRLDTLGAPAPSAQASSAQMCVCFLSQSCRRTRRRCHLDWISCRWSGGFLFPSWEEYGSHLMLSFSDPRSNVTSHP